MQPLPTAQEPLRPAAALVRLMRQGEREMYRLRPYHEAGDSAQVRSRAWRELYPSASARD
jgi:hypothetical protein